MKTGMTLHEMATALEATKAAKQDFVGPTDQVYVTPDLNVEIKGSDTRYDLTHHAARQITTWAGVPAEYADRCPSDLLSVQLNHWLNHGPSKTPNGPMARMLRTLQPNPYLGIETPTVRAFVSDKYRVIDNWDVAQAVLPVLLKEEHGNVKVHSCNVGQHKFYLKATIEGVEENVLREGHVLGQGHNTYYKVKPGIEIGNSETGQGSFYVAPALWDESCTNLATFRTNCQKRYHVGSAQSDGELWSMLSDETQRISNEALMAQMADYVRSALDASGEVFQKTVNDLREKMGIPVIKPEATMKLVADKFGLSQGESDGILGELMERGDLNVFGIQAAVTRFSQRDDVTYDRASELEGIGGNVLELPMKDWTELLVAA